MTQLAGPPTLKGVEDCLYLSIYTPALSSSPKPVMLWIHGGGFKEGDATDLTDPEFIIDEDVVFVALQVPLSPNHSSVQYRLGVLGFLALGTPEVPGNLGIKDQQEAMRWELRCLYADFARWVQRNIEHFGGNPEKVTIFGESAGGVSVHSHVLSPGSANLFRAAIMQSGTALMTYERTIRRGAEKESRRVVEELGCGEETNPVPCLRRLDVANLTDPALKDNLWVVQVGRAGSYGVSLVPGQYRTSASASLQPSAAASVRHVPQVTPTLHPDVQGACYEWHHHA